MKRITSLKPNELNQKPEPRGFLTKKSSWFKLGSFGLVIIFLVWLAVKPNSPQTKNQTALNDKGGKVAGVETTRNNAPTNSDQTDKSTYSNPAPSDHISGGGDETDTKTTTNTPQTETNSNEPSLAQQATTKLIGSDNSSDLESILKSGKLYLDQNKLTQADSLFTRATEVAPEYRDAWYLLGYTQLKEFEQSKELPINNLNFAQKALISLTKAHTIDPLADNVNQLLNTAQKAVLTVK